MTSGGDTVAPRGPSFFGTHDFSMLAHLKQKIRKDSQRVHVWLSHELQ